MNTNIFYQLGDKVASNDWTKLTAPFTSNFNCTNGYPVVIASSGSLINSKIKTIAINKGKIYFNQPKVIDATLDVSEASLICKAVSGNFYQYKLPINDKIVKTGELFYSGSYRASWGQPFGIKRFDFMEADINQIELTAPPYELLELVYITARVNVTDWVTHPASDDLGMEYVDTLKMSVRQAIRI